MGVLGAIPLKETLHVEWRNAGPAQAEVTHLQVRMVESREINQQDVRQHHAALRMVGFQQLGDRMEDGGGKSDSSGSPSAPGMARASSRGNVNANATGSTSPAMARTSSRGNVTKVVPFAKETEDTVVESFDAEDPHEDG
jgi:hypothetical protein